MSTQTTAHTMAIQASRKPSAFTLERFWLYLILCLFAFMFLMPIYVMLVNSIKPLDEIRAGNLVALPLAPTIEPWVQAWSQAQIGVQATGLKPYFLNSFLMVIPAVLISTALGALNGYVLTQFKVKGGTLLFGLVLFSVFIPFQIVLIPMARLLGELGLAGSGSDFGSHGVRHWLWHLVLPKFLRRVPTRVGEVSAHGWRWLFRLVLALDVARQSADCCCQHHLAVHQHME